MIELAGIDLDVDIGLVGAIAGSLTTLAYLPQVVRVWRTRSADDLSWPTFLCLWVGVLMWIVYGLLLGEGPIVIANVVTLGLATLIMIGKAVYSTRRNVVRRRLDR